MNASTVWARTCSLPRGYALGLAVPRMHTHTLMDFQSNPRPHGLLKIWLIPLGPSSTQQSNLFIGKVVKHWNRLPRKAVDDL